MERIGNPQDDAQVYIPMETAREVLNVPEKYDMLMAKVSDAGAVQQVADRIKKRLREYRNVKEGEEDFTIQTINDLRDTYGTVMAIIQAVVIGIAAISLFVGGVGIMNTMYTAVTERRKDIGIMKSIGAKNSHILILFLIESGMIGIIGGALGIILGFGISFLVQLIAEAYGIVTLKASFSFILISGALLFSFFMGAVSGVVPAIQASKLQPVEALRKK
jgi:putative ABC transport system permease protein